MLRVASIPGTEAARVVEQMMNPAKAANDLRRIPFFDGDEWLGLLEKVITGSTFFQAFEE